MEKSYYKDGKLYEKFRIHHYREYKTVNRTEAFMVKEIKETCSNPISCTIGELKSALSETLKRHMVENPSHGKCTFGDTRVVCTIIGHDNWVEREFSLTANGRKMCSIIIAEDIFKDSNNNLSVVPGELFVYNKIETIS